jgi:N,N'-diacetyllegionaminate synthase
MEEREMKKISIIAETAWHHEGDFEFMKNLVFEICNTETDIVKLHITLDIDEYMSKNHPAYDTLKDWMLNEKQWTQVIEIVKKAGKKLMLLYNDEKAVEFGTQFNPEMIEIHSVCLNDIHLISKINNTVSTDARIVLGVGGSTVYEIENAIQLLNNFNIVLMFGFQNYPTKYEDINFEKVRKTMRLFSDYEFGYADHCAWNEANNILITLLGASQGMQYIEKHVTTKHGEKRCDWNSAISFEMFNSLADKIKVVNACQGDGLLKLNEGEQNYSVFGPMKKAAILNKDVNENVTFSLDVVDFKRTGVKTDLSQIDVFNSIGMQFQQTLTKGILLNSKHIK